MEWNSVTSSGIDNHWLVFWLMPDVDLPFGPVLYRYIAGVRTICVINWFWQWQKAWTRNSAKNSRVKDTKDNVNLLKVSFFGQRSKMQLIPLQNVNDKTCFIQFLWFFRLKCWFKGQIISRIHLSLPNAYKLMCYKLFLHVFKSH